MKFHYFGTPFSIFIILLFNLNASAQNGKDLWIKTSKEKVSTSRLVERKTLPAKALYFKLDINGLKDILQDAPNRNGFNEVSNVEVSFPNPDGSFETYSVLEASVMHPDLQSRHPDIRTYIGQSIDNPSTIMRFSITPQGLHTMTLTSGQGTHYIDPYSKDDNSYIIYSKKDLPNLKNEFICGVMDQISAKGNNNDDIRSRNANDGMMRDFRLALASTIEYSEFHWTAAGLMVFDTDEDKKAAVIAAMVVTMNRVNGLYERDLSITMTLIANNEDIIFVGNSDPYNNNNGSVMLNQNQTEIDNTIGTANYDIGHVFSTGGGGIASLGVPCVEGSKAKGVTGFSSPVGDAYDIDFVAHEMGHQFGANHTFNGDAGNCAGGNRVGSNAYEPGSGSTIMAYAGICTPQNVQPNSDAYFHQASISEIWSYVTTGTGTCAAQAATGNSAPTAIAGNDYTIPISTPYKLTGSSTDTDGTGSHTFTWEQFDLGSAGLPLETNLIGPLVRSFEGTTDPVRYIPQLSHVISNGGVSSTWEKLASVGRTINFQLTVRDNGVSGGQTHSDDMVVTTDATAGPFTVTSQSTMGVAWTPSTTETITWNVSNSDMAPVSTSNVNILLSTDGGTNFNTVLKSNTPNDGTEDITVPNIPSSNCRIMVEAAGNIFYAVNSERFSLGVITTCTQYTSAQNLNLDIEDGAGDNSPGATLFHTINVPDSDIIDYIKINADISHTYIQDLVVQIQHPDGSTFAIVWNRNCENEIDLDVIFEDGAPTIVCAEPTTGTYAPASPLNVFSGLDAIGDWNIAITDYFIADIGTLNDWYVEVCVTTTLSRPDYENLEDLTVFPNPNHGEFEVRLNSNSSENIKIDVYDLRGRRIFNNIYNGSVVFNEVVRLNNVQSGLYILKVSDGSRTGIKKIIVK